MIAGTLEFDPGTYERLMERLRRPWERNENAAFAFVDRGDASAPRNCVREVRVLEAEDYAFQGPLFLEVQDRVRGELIKRAHDLGAFLAEFHSHPGSLEPSFSASDLRGLAEFVPHVRWRLRGAPYMAFVVGADGFDSLAWMNPDRKTCGAAGILVNGRVELPTGITFRELGKKYG